ncbi:hypothetical protein LZ32DRAFT_609045 [Colletotrichum eremochloae]|nr:hypothetical protein LZ32DRAFT_609045 [Colletotrichum eremochloae]
MLSQRFSAVLFLLLGSAFFGTIFAEPQRPFAGVQAYAVDYDWDDETGRWAFKIYSDGYKHGKEPVNIIMVNTQSKRLTILEAMNGLDTLQPRLKMRQVLKACWDMANLQPSDLKEVLAYRIENKDMMNALADCRKGMQLAPSDSFVVSLTDTDPAKTSCWSRIGSTVFASAIRGSILEFDISKRVSQIKVDYGVDQKGAWDHMYYEFSE